MSNIVEGEPKSSEVVLVEKPLSELLRGMITPEGEVVIPEELIGLKREFKGKERWISLGCHREKRPNVFRDEKGEPIPSKQLRINLLVRRSRGRDWTELRSLDVFQPEDPSREPEMIIWTEAFKSLEIPYEEHFKFFAYRLSDGGMRADVESYTVEQAVTLKEIRSIEAREGRRAQWRQAGVVGMEELPRVVNVLDTTKELLEYTAKCFEAKERGEDPEAIPIPDLVAVSETA